MSRNMATYLDWDDPSIAEEQDFCGYVWMPVSAIKWVVTDDKWTLMQLWQTKLLNRGSRQLYLKNPDLSEWRAVPVEIHQPGGEDGPLSEPPGN